MKNSLDELRSVAIEVVAQRPEWDLGAVLQVLMGHQYQPILEVRAGAMKAAMNGSVRSPVGIDFAQHWTRSAPLGVSGGYNPLPECRTCGQPAGRDESESLLLCPGCGEPWDAVAYRHGVDYRRGRG